MRAELLIFVGLQASGKTTFYEAHFRDTHVLVSKDRLRNNRKPGQRQRTLVASALAEGRSVVVDNTNPTLEDRQELLDLAREAGVPVVAYVFTAGIEECLGRNRDREGRARVPDAALYITRSRLVWPTRAEGYDAMYRVEILPQGGFRVGPFGLGPDTAGAP